MIGQTLTFLASPKLREVGYFTYNIIILCGTLFFPPFFTSWGGGGGGGKSDREKAVKSWGPVIDLSVCHKI